MNIKKEEQINNAFITTILEVRKGKSVSELSDALTELVRTVRETGKPGALTYKIMLKPANADADALVLSDEINSKNPQPNRLAAMFYATEDNQLVRDDPNQKKLPLTMIEGGKRDDAPKAKAAEAK